MGQEEMNNLLVELQVSVTNIIASMDKMDKKIDAMAEDMKLWKTDTELCKYRIESAESAINRAHDKLRVHDAALQHHDKIIFLLYVVGGVLAPVVTILLTKMIGL